MGMSVALPTIFDAYPSNDRQNVVKVSRIGACIVGSSYIAFLIFQLITHAATLKKDEAQNDDDDDDDEEEGAGITIRCAIALMFVTTVVVAASSEFLVDA